MGLFSIIGKAIKGTSYTEEVVECLKKHRSLMFRDGLIDPLQVIKLLGLYDKFLLYVETGAEGKLPAADVAAFWFKKLEHVYMTLDMERVDKRRPRLVMTDYGMMDDEQLPKGVTHVQTFLKTQKNLELTPFQLIIFGLATQSETDAYFRKSEAQDYTRQVLASAGDYDLPEGEAAAFCEEAFEAGVSVEECSGMFWELVNLGFSFAEQRRRAYHETVMTFMDGDLRWQQHFKRHPRGVFAFVMNEEFSQGVDDLYDRGVPAEQTARELVRFFTDGPTPIFMQAALHKAGAYKAPTLTP